MTQLQKEALVLFKDYTMLELKAYKANVSNKLQGKAAGAVEPYELQVIDEAIELHRTYRTIKNNQSIKK